MDSCQHLHFETTDDFDGIIPTHTLKKLDFEISIPCTCGVKEPFLYICLQCETIAGSASQTQYLSTFCSVEHIHSHSILVKHSLFYNVKEHKIECH